MVLFSTMGVSLKDAYGTSDAEVKKKNQDLMEHDKFFTGMEKDPENITNMFILIHHKNK